MSERRDCAIFKPAFFAISDPIRPVLRKAFKTAGATAPCNKFCVEDVVSCNRLMERAPRVSKFSSITAFFPNSKIKEAPLASLVAKLLRIKLATSRAFMLDNACFQILSLKISMVSCVVIPKTSSV